MHSRWGPFVEANEYLFGGAPLNTAGASLVHVGLLAAVFWMTWLVVRDVPIRNKSGNA